MSISPYIAKTWVDYADTPDLSAAELNRLDSGIASVTAEVLSLEALLPSTYQPISSELSALSGLSSTGYAKRTGAGAWSVASSIPQADVAGLSTALAAIPLPSVTAPLVNGTAAIGSLSTRYALADHVHPKDTSRQPLDADLTAIAGLSTQTFGRSLLTLADAAAGRSTLGAEGSLGKPSSDGQALVSTTAGVRSWVTLTTGTVTSVGLSAPANMTASGSPVTGSGTLSLAWSGSSDNLVRADGSTVAASTYALASAIPAASTTTPAALGTAAVGSGTTWARADHVHAMPTAANVGAEPALGSPGTSGYLLSSTSAGVRSWVAPYSLPTATASVLGGVMVGTGLSISSSVLSVSYGTAAGTACVGNDSRLSDSRTPTAHALDGALHTISGKTAGQVLLATAATTFAFTTISGHATLSAAGALTLASSGVTAGTYGSATVVPVPTVDAYGRVTGMSTATITQAALGGPFLPLGGGNLTGGITGTTATFTGAVSQGGLAVWRSRVGYDSLQWAIYGSSVTPASTNFSFAAEKDGTYALINASMGTIVSSAGTTLLNISSSAVTSTVPISQDGIAKWQGLVGYTSDVSAFYGGGITPSTSNYGVSIAKNGSNTSINGTTSSIMAVNNTAIATATASTFTVSTNFVAPKVTFGRLNASSAIAYSTDVARTLSSTRGLHIYNVAISTTQTLPDGTDFDCIIIKNAAGTAVTLTGKFMNSASATIRPYMTAILYWNAAWY